MQFRKFSEFFGNLCIENFLHIFAISAIYNFFESFPHFLKICALETFRFWQFFWKFAIFPISDVLQNLCKIINLPNYMQQSKGASWTNVCNKRQFNKSLQQASVEQFFWNKRQLNAQDVTRTMRVLLAVKKQEKNID